MRQPAAASDAAPRFFYGWVIVAVAFFVVFSEGPSRSTILSLFIVPVTTEFGWSRTALTGAVALGGVAGSVVSPIVGPIVDRRGPRGVIVIGAAITGLAVSGLAFVQSLWQFYILAICTRAFSSSAVMLGTNVVVANWFIRRRGRAMAISRLGTWVAMPFFLIVAQAIIAAYGWRTAWFAMGLVTLTVATVPPLLFIRRRPEDMGLTPDGLPLHSPARDGETGARAAPPLDVSWTLSEAIRTRTLWILVFTAGLGTIVSQAVNLHAVAAFIDRGLAPSTAALAITVLVVTSGVSSLLWGLVGDRVHPRYAAAVAFMFCIVGTLAIIRADTPLLAYAYGFFYGIGFSGIGLMEDLMFANYFGRHSLGTIRGFTRPVQMVAGAGGPVFAGLVYDLRGSYDIAFTVFLAAFVLAAFFILFASPPRKPALVPPPPTR